jgi:hypothetical protein
MLQHGVDQCKFEILRDHVPTLTDLALTEIQLIEEHDTFKNGLNQTKGGDGLGRTSLLKLSEEEVAKIRQALGGSMSEYNTNVKWDNTSLQDRKQMLAHLHTPEVAQKKSDTLRRYYEANPNARTEKGQIISHWRAANREAMVTNNKKASAAASLVNQKQVKVETEDGSVTIYSSLKEFKEKAGVWPDYVLKKTKQGLYHKGYKAWRI